MNIIIISDKKKIPHLYTVFGFWGSLEEFLDGFDEFVEIAKTKQDSNYFYKKSCLSSSQIWLGPLVDACQSHVLHKIEEGKKKEKEKENQTLVG